MLRPLAPPLGHGLHGDAPPPAATRAAQPRLEDGTQLDDRVGYRFAVLASRRLADALPAETRATLDDTDVVLVIATGEAAEYLANLRVDAVVIRPDRYILGVASTPAELNTILTRRRPRAAPKSVSRPLPQSVTAG